MIWTHGLQHTRLSCPSLFLWDYSNSCPLRWWCYLTISSPAFPFSYRQSFPISGYFSMSWLFTSRSHRIGASASVLPMTMQGWFPLRLTGLIALQSKRLSRVFSSTTEETKSSILQHSVFFMVQLSHPYMTTGKIIALTIWMFVGKVISLFFNMLPRLIIAFLLRSKCLLISWLQSLSTGILEK